MRDTFLRDLRRFCVKKLRQGNTFRFSAFRQSCRPVPHSSFHDVKFTNHDVKFTFYDVKLTFYVVKRRMRYGATFFVLWRDKDVNGE